MTFSLKFRSRPRKSAVGIEPGKDDAADPRGGFRKLDAVAIIQVAARRD